MHRCLEPWQNRVVEEKLDLAEKIVKLGAFIQKQRKAAPADRVASEQDLDALERQEAAMRAYWFILDERVARF